MILIINEKVQNSSKIQLKERKKRGKVLKTIINTYSPSNISATAGKTKPADMSPSDKIGEPWALLSPW